MRILVDECLPEEVVNWLKAWDEPLHEDTPPACWITTAGIRLMMMTVRGNGARGYVGRESEGREVLRLSALRSTAA